MMMMTLTLISGTSIAIAMCRHQGAQMHIVALQDSDRNVAAEAHLEEAAASAASKRGTLADAGALSLPAFIIPDPVGPVASLAGGAIRWRPARTERATSWSVDPLLRPPAA
jgi:hypothetical protein